MKFKANEVYKTKSMPSFVKSIEGRRVVGLAAVIGNVDDGGDRIMPGAFSKTLKENTRRLRHLWEHGADGWDWGVTPPIAAIRSIQEVGRDALPQAVLAFAPDAMGGLEVDREYLTTPRGDEILAAYQSGVQLEMSIGYRVVKEVAYSEGAIGRVSLNHNYDLVEIKLFDTSDVNWGMNSATVGAKSVQEKFATIVSQLKLLRPELAACVDEKLLDEFRELCNFMALPAPEQSRAEPVNRVSLTPALKRLIEFELALVS